MVFNKFPSLGHTFLSIADNKIKDKEIFISFLHVTYNLNVVHLILKLQGSVLYDSEATAISKNQFSKLSI